MADIKTVMSWLETLAQDDWRRWYSDSEVVETSKAALELLKEQSEHGHWVVLENCSNAGVYCSRCNVRVFAHYPMKMNLAYFCPHCGIRMERQVMKLDD